MGYPTYFMTIHTIWCILAGVALIVPRFPRLKEWAYAGFFFDLTSAAIARAAVGDAAADIIAPLVFLALVLASWALRPASRKLASASAPHRLSTVRVGTAFVDLPARS